MKLRIILFSIVAFLFASVAANASGVGMTMVTKKSDKDETLFSVGLRFSVGDMVPKAVVGVRQTTTDKDSDVTGYQADLAVPLTPDGFAKSEVRVLGLVGDRDLLGQGGIGYKFGSNQVFAAAGVQGSNVEGGVNFGLDGMFDPYIGVNSLGRPTGPKKETISTMPIMPTINTPTTF